MKKFTIDSLNQIQRRHALQKVTGIALTSAAALAGFSSPAVQAQTAASRVLVKTSMGEITIELYPERSPVTVTNFLTYVEAKFYDGTVFHRVIRNFMIQGGGYTVDGTGAGQSLKQKPTRKPIILESQNGLRNDTGWVAMARTNNPNSATSQFFINTVDNDNLNYPRPDGLGYAVFGKVVQGMDIVNKIRGAQTIGIGPFSDVPHDPIKIDSISVIK